MWDSFAREKVSSTVKVGTLLSYSPDWTALQTSEQSSPRGIGHAASLILQAAWLKSRLFLLPAPTDARTDARP